MTTVKYDGSFAGLLTAVFEVFEYKIGATSIVQKGQTLTWFGEPHFVVTSPEKASRVWKGLERYVSKDGLVSLWKTFLSEESGREDHLLAYCRYVFSEKKSVEMDFTHQSVLYISQTARKVHREKHRMEAFIRFKETADGSYVATIAPDFNVLPLITKHFKERYADQKWMIADVKRGYAMLYDLEEVYPVETRLANGQGFENLLELHDQETPYQSLWQTYFKSVNIQSRKNSRLHVRHMPLRYWKFLTEKQAI